MADVVRKKIHCNNCGRSTTHERKHRYKVGDSDDQGWWDETASSLWSCAGCETAVLEIAYTHAQMHEEGEQYYDLTYYPERAVERRATKVFSGRLPDKLVAIYEESVQALNGGLSRLCAGGLRAVIEGICIQEDATGYTLEKKIDALRDKGKLPASIVKSIHGFRFMGNQALHEFDAPKRADLVLALDVCEDLLNFLYELDYKASQLLQRQPGRPPKATATLVILPPDPPIPTSPPAAASASAPEDGEEER